MNNQKDPKDNARVEYVIHVTNPQKYTLKNIYENLRGYSEPHMRTAECLIFGEGTWWVLKSIFPDLKARYPEITIKYKEVMQ
jgi:hypothetical protein